MSWRRVWQPTPIYLPEESPWTEEPGRLQSMEFSRPEYWRGLPCSPPGDLPNPGIEPRSLALQADSSPAEPPGKPKNIGVCSPSLLQGIFPTQELNRGLWHCRWILYQLSYQGSPLYRFYNQNPNHEIKMCYEPKLRHEIQSNF